MSRAIIAQDVAQLLARTAVVRKMDETELVSIVPNQSGLRYIGCPNCNSGRQEGQLAWTIDRPNEVYCRYCDHRYPSEKYPMNEVVTVQSPRGETARFEYWADDKGYRYFFKARRDDEVRGYMSACALDLARLYVATNDRSHARRSAVIIDRFAEVFPGWCYHFDYPFEQKVIYDGDVRPEKFRAGYRTARWNWWAYMDIPDDLVRAYALIRKSGVLADLSKERGVDVELRIRSELLRSAGEQVFANPEPYTNMSPTAWRSLITLGKAIDEPRYVHEVVRRLNKFIDLQFFYDGSWYEGAPSYGAQTLSGLENVLAELRGYTDPVGYIDPVDGKRLENLDMEKEFPTLAQARTALQKLRLPNGREVPINDTWATASQRTSSRRRVAGANAIHSNSYLLPALGHACMNFGIDQHATQFHLSWSGGYGHQHADGLNLMLFAHTKEMLSDLGYTHTAYRPWVISTVAHNTVVIDGMSQAMGSKKTPSDGNLRFADFLGKRVQVVSADAKRVYPDVAKVFRRTLVAIEVDQDRHYALDFFEVEGGRTHDYFLHGDSDAPTNAEMEGLNWEKLDSLLPSGFDWKPTVNEGQSHRATEPHYPYGFLRNLRSTAPVAGQTVGFFFKAADQTKSGLHVFIVPEPNIRFIMGDNPSVRQAQEDDSQLEKFLRPFIMLRHISDQGRSKFVSVLEPYETAPFIQSVERIPNIDGALVMKIVIGERTDWIIVGADKQVSIANSNSIPSVFRGKVGVLSLQNNEIEHAYALGEGGWQAGVYHLIGNRPQRAMLHAIDRGEIVVSQVGLTLPVVGDIVRLETDDAWTYPFNVTSAERDGDSIRIRVAEGPGMEFQADINRLRLTSFPQREHTGAVHVEWMSSNSR